jgi:transcriptional regulator with XRE-family HTH domain
VTRETPYPQPALGKAIRELREAREVSLRALAPKAGLTFNTLSLIERGEANPTWQTVRQIAEALGVSIGELAVLSEKHGDDEGTSAT